MTRFEWYNGFVAEITDVRPQKKNPQRVNLFVDGKFVLGLDLETALKEKLEIGKEISQEEIKRLSEISGRQKILEKVFKFLSYRPRSQKETRDYLAKKKIDLQESESIIQELTRNKYLDDEEFTRWWIEQRISFRPRGLRLLKIELKQKGINNELIDKMIYDLRFKNYDELELAKKLIEKRLERYQNLPLEEKKQKLAAFLARRGFDWETIKETVDGVLKR